MAKTVKFTITTDQAQAIRGLAKFAVEMKKIEERTKKAAAAAREQGRAVDKAGDSMSNSVGKMLKMAAGYISIGAAAGAAMMAIRDFQAESERIAAKQSQSELGISQLKQISKGDPDRFAHLIAESKKTFTEGGARSLEEAAAIQFQISSADLENQRKLVSESFETFGGDTSSVVKSAVSLQTAFGEKETGSFRDILSKATAVSDFTTANVPEILSGAASAGVSASALGISDEEVLAAVSILAKANEGSASIGGTQAEAIITAMLKQGEIGGTTFKGRSFAENITSIAEHDFKDDAEIIKFFGRKEGFKGAGVLSKNLGQLESIAGGLGTAVDEDRIGVTNRLGDTNPALFAAKLKRQEDAINEIEKENRGVLFNLAEAAETRLDTVEEKRGEGRITRFVHRQTRGVQRTLFGDESSIQNLEGKAEQLERRGPRAVDTGDAFGSFNIQGQGAEPSPEQLEIASGLRDLAEVIRRQIESTDALRENNNALIGINGGNGSE